MRVGMNVVVSLVVGALAVPSVRADPEEARKLLELSAGAVQNLQTLSADIEVGATGGFANFLASAKGKLMVARMPEEGQPSANRNPFEFRLTGKGQKSPKQPEIEFDAIYRDKRYEWMADAEKQQRIRSERIASRDKEVSLAKDFLLDDIFTGKPLSASIGAEELTLVESKTIDGVSCEGVRVPMGTGGGYMIFYIPRSDFIPRRIERGTTAASEGISFDGTMFKELTNVKVNQGLPESAFTMVIPVGYAPDPNPARVRPPIPRGLPGRPNVDAAPRRPLASPFELKTAQGETVVLGDLRGRVVVLDFWGTWLPESARQGMGTLQSLSEHFVDQPVAFYGLNFRERDPNKAVEFFENGGFTYNLLLDADEVQRRYGVRTFPTMYIIGFDGEVVDVVSGYKEETTLKGMIKTIEEHLAEQAEKTNDAGTVTGTGTITGSGSSAGGG